MYLLDKNGKPVNAEFSFSSIAGNFSIMVESSGGATARRDRRNPEYNKLVGILLERLQAHSISITGVFLESTRYQALPVNKRTVDVGREYPISPKELDTESLRTAIGRGLAKLLQAPGVQTNGNSQKRFRIELDRRVSAENVAYPSPSPMPESSPSLRRFVGQSTEAEQIVMARNGQGVFRHKLLTKYHNTCAITNVADPTFLVASHIKPWSDGTDEERMDIENGLLLFTSYDRAFDQGLITLDQNGIVVYSKHLASEVKDLLNFSPLKVVTLSDKQSRYLEYHRKWVFRK